MQTTLRALVWLVLSLVGVAVHAGNLKVTLAPANAVNAGAQWRVDGGTWRTSGYTEKNLSNTTHLLEFKAVPGWIAPAATNITITGGTTSLTSTYVQAAGLSITLAPASGQWRVDGGIWRASGATATGLAPGSHVIDYAAIAGYAAPASENVTLTAGQTSTFNRSYTALASVSVTLSPAAAQWRVDGGAWRASGTTAANLTPGNHTIDYSTVSGYAAPAAETVTLASGQSLPLARSYVQLGQITVTLNVTSAQWRANGGAWQASGATLANLPAGNYTLEYTTLAMPWGTPAAETVTLAVGQSLSLTRAYYQMGQIMVTLVPSSGTWRVNGGAWQPSGASVWVQPDSTNTIDYSPLAGYDSPASETVGGGFGATRYYVSQKPTLRINLSPGTGQWRVDGGIWQASGSVVTELATGSHTIDYTDVGGEFAPLASESVSLALRENLTLARTYPLKPAQLTVALTPADATWSVSGPVNSSLQASGATLSLPPGNYQVQYSGGANHTPLSPEMITLAPGEARTLARTYAPLPAHLVINTNLAEGRSRVYPQSGPANGTWNANNVTLELPPATYVAEYLAIPGYEAPPTETVALTPNQYLVLNRSYAVTPTRVSYTLSPAEAQWRIFPEGSAPAGAWNASGATVTGLATGNYRVEFSDVAGHTKPAGQSLTLTAGQNVQGSATYDPIEAQLFVTLVPSTAKFRFNNSIHWTPSGGAVMGITPGTYPIEFSDEAGLTTPAPQMLTFAWGDVKRLRVPYGGLPPPTLTVHTTPAGGQFRVDGGAWCPSGTTVNPVSIGSHQVEFSAQVGYVTPAPVTLEVLEGENKVHTQQYYLGGASLSITLQPGTARWRVDGGGWIASGWIIMFGSGPHTVEYEPAAGYLTPPVENILLEVNENRAFTRTYSPNTASVTVTLTPATAQWRIYSGATPSGPWSSSGVTVSGLAPGSYSIAYAPLAGYTAPNPETLTLVAGENRTLTRSYALPVGGYTEIAALPDLGTTPYMIRGSDGVLYGVTSSQGGNGSGTLFKVNPDGSGFVLLRSFAAHATDGTTPTALLEGSDGWLYGVTNYGGSETNKGMIFRASRDGSAFSTVYVFTSTAEGLSPNTLVEASDGSLYGTTLTGGTGNTGVIFKLSKTGTGYTVLKHLSTMSVQGRHASRLAESADGGLYGTVSTVGSSTLGQVYRIGKDGAGFAVVKSFAGGADGSSPRVPLLRGGDGRLYGITATGGMFSRGTLFRLNADGTNHTILKHFLGDTTEGGSPNAELTEDASGTLYGATLSGGPGTRGTVYKLNRDGTGFTTLKTFDGSAAEGGAVQLSPILVSNGLLCGVSRFGGAANDGVIFRLGTDGSGFAVIRHLSAPLGTSILTPVAEGPDGVLYGTTLLGGATREGTLFKVNKDGTGLTALRHFTNERATYSNPVLVATDGLVYGTTSSSTGGQLYRINPDGTGLAVVRSFTTEGAPQSMIEGSDGLLYGTTGGNSSSATFGSIFRINRDGSGYTVLKTFNGGAADGKYPYSGVTEGADGFLYGTTAFGGPADLGTVYRIAKNGTGFTVLKTFVTAATDGSQPWATVTYGSDGFLYGTTSIGGSAGLGAVYRLAPDGTAFTLLRSFLGAAGNDGSGPNYATVTEHNGMLYGLTGGAGAFSRGTLYRLNRDGSGYTTLINFGALLNEGSVPANSLLRSTDGYLYGTTFRGGLGSVIFRFAP